MLNTGSAAIGGLLLFYGLQIFAATHLTIPLYVSTVSKRTEDNGRCSFSWLHRCALARM